MLCSESMCGRQNMGQKTSQSTTWQIVNVQSHHQPCAELTLTHVLLDHVFEQHTFANRTFFAGRRWSCAPRVVY